MSVAPCGISKAKFAESMDEVTSSQALRAGLPCSGLSWLTNFHQERTGTLRRAGQPSRHPTPGLGAHGSWGHRIPLSGFDQEDSGGDPQLSFLKSRCDNKSTALSSKMTEPHRREVPGSRRNPATPSDPHLLPHATRLG